MSSLEWNSTKGWVRPEAKLRNGLKHLRQKLSISSKEEVSRQLRASGPTAASLPPPLSQLYKNVPLSHADAIRLLTIHPGQRQDILRCSLYATRLNLRAQAEYSALSYMWGSRDKAQFVIVDDEILTIHLNLLQFLLRLRHPYGDIVVWADAICINQNDPAEKGQQVQLMSRIYSQASRTMIWLGESMPDLSRLVSNYYDAEHIDISDMMSSGAAEKALVDLIEHEYWTRAWILQEVVLAKEVVTYTGRQDIAWHDFFEMYSNIIQRYTETTGGIYVASKLDRMLKESMMMLLRKRRDEMALGQNTTFPDLLRDHWRTKCQNRQDRIFGLVGLITDENDPLYPISLSPKAAEVFDYTLPLRTLADRVQELYGYQKSHYWGDLEDALIW